MRFPRWLTVVLIGLIGLGVVFRFVNLNHKVYWHDETYTSMRASGYTRSEIDQAIFQNRAITATTLQQYQRIKPGSSPMDTVRSLAREDPQHPPLYFLMTRFWMQLVGDPFTSLFKSPLSVTRSLPALLSLLALPAMYGLAWELFAAHSIALMATALIAISPYDVLFAQTARQYSLLTVMVIASSYLLLRAMRLFQAIATSSASAQRHAIREPETWVNWGLYALSVAIGLYTQPFFSLTLIGHMVYVLACLSRDTAYRHQRWSIFKFFAGSVAIALIAFSPWIVVMAMNSQQAISTTDWTRTAPNFNYLLKLWILSFTALFSDLNFGFYNYWSYVLRLPFLFLIGVSLYYLVRRTKFSTWWFVVSSIAVPFLLLLIPDLILGGKRSAVSRYLVSCYPGVQLAVAHFLAIQLASKRIYSGRSPVFVQAQSSYTLRPNRRSIGQTWLSRGVLAIVVFISVLSLTISALAFSWWNKDLSFVNNQTADLLNKTTSPIMISDMGDDRTNTGELLSLSYLLKGDTPLLLLKSPDFVSTPEFQAIVQNKTAIAFRPSGVLYQNLEQTYGRLLQILTIERLWEIPVTSNNKPKTNEGIKKKD